MNIKNLSKDSQHMLELTTTYLKEVKGEDSSVYESLDYLLSEFHSFSGFKPPYDVKGKFERGIRQRREVLRRIEDNKRMDRIREQQKLEAARERAIKAAKAEFLQKQAEKIVDGYGQRCEED